MASTNGHTYYKPKQLMNNRESAVGYQGDEDEIQNESDKSLITEVQQWPIVYNKKAKMKEDITEAEAWEVIGAKLQRSGIFFKAHKHDCK